MSASSILQDRFGLSHVLCPRSLLVAPPHTHDAYLTWVLGAPSSSSPRSTAIVPGSPSELTFPALERARERSRRMNGWSVCWYIQHIPYPNPRIYFVKAFTARRGVIGRSNRKYWGIFSPGVDQGRTEGERELVGSPVKRIDSSEKSHLLGSNKTHYIVEVRAKTT